MRWPWASTSPGSTARPPRSISGSAGRDVDVPPPPGEDDAAGPDDQGVDDAIARVERVDAAVGQEHRAPPTRLRWRACRAPARRAEDRPDGQPDEEQDAEEPPGAARAEDDLEPERVGEPAAEERPHHGAREHHRLVERHGLGPMGSRGELEQEREVGQVVAGPDEPGVGLEHADLPGRGDPDPGGGDDRDQEAGERLGLQRAQAVHHAAEEGAADEPEERVDAREESDGPGARAEVTDQVDVEEGRRHLKREVPHEAAHDQSEERPDCRRPRSRDRSSCARPARPARPVRLRDEQEAGGARQARHEGEGEHGLIAEVRLAEPAVPGLDEPAGEGRDQERREHDHQIAIPEVLRAQAAVGPGRRRARSTPGCRSST